MKIKNGSFGYNKFEFIKEETPIHKLENISKDLDVNLFIKRDDLTSYGVGGNKLRKLEYLMFEAIQTGADVIVTTGGAQTNHGRLTAAVSNLLEKKCVIVTTDEKPKEISANLLLDGIMGCDVCFKPNRSLEEAIDEVFQDIEARGEKPYFIPMGGSNELGLLGYYDCSIEIDRQIKENEELNNGSKLKTFVTVGSCGTYLGMKMAVENENLNIDLEGIQILPYEEGVQNYLAEYYKKAKEKFNLKHELKPDDFRVDGEYFFGAYNNPVKEVREAIYYMARREAIILDPCYTGKTFNAILRKIKKGEIKKDSNVLFMHTGGLPGIYTTQHRVEFEKDLESYFY
ncbi:MAG: pyridoxal-phosphate dependent enzyme [Eubacteriales bacterium]|nr:pyridoxal-phosphate dependent enzyme [Eubacteriales bacterium]MDY3332457.1 pyridoxal-phosphate dependent enzyme [Gallibacter sp.]